MMGLGVHTRQQGEGESDRQAQISMVDIPSRIFGDLVGRTHGPMNFRIILQPLMAIIFAVLDGRKDARHGRPPFLRAMFADPEHRRGLLRSGWKSVRKVFVIALILDAVYQYTKLRWFYPGEALVTAFVLAIVPYILLRGLVNRLTRLSGK
jgi:hypothetical protein